MVVGLVLGSLATVLAQGSPPTAAPPPLLRLHRGTLDLRAPDRPAPGSTLSAPAPGSYAILQFSAPVTPADRAALEHTGVKILEYLPDYAYLVRGAAPQLAAAAALPAIYGRAPLTLADKIDPGLLGRLARGERNLGRVQVIGWPDEHESAMPAVRAAGIDLSQPVSAAQVVDLARLVGVRWIEPARQPRLLNNNERGIMNVDSAWSGRQLFGAGQLVAVTDSGLDTGNMATLSPDFASRLVATHVLSPGNSWDDNNGHGTHVAGSAAGAGIRSGATPASHAYGPSFAGVAPEAGLIVQAFEADAEGNITGLGSDLYPVYSQVYADGARVHTNSWGDYTGPASDPEATFGGYPFWSQRTDQFIWEHPDAAVLFAAGNSGIDGVPGTFGFCTDGDGVIDPDSLVTPATAKNVITVGASESTSTGGFSTVPWLLMSFCFGTEPIASDTLASNANGMAAFSSRGPTDDGRTKPDLVAPGTNVVSNRSYGSGAGTMFGVHESNGDYVYSGGTSMATPLVAGSAVLIRQWLGQQGLANPSAAAIKAMLLNTTADMAPGQYGTGPAREIPAGRPNSVAGWGRASLGWLNAPVPYGLWLDDHAAGLSTGQMVTYASTEARPLEVLTSTQPLRVMLAWTDPPASLAASRQLVNDLDLLVTGPGGTIYAGNAATDGDRLNNVEGVVINNPPPGQYSVKVRAHNVPIADQPYALVVAGPINPAAPPPPTATPTTAPTTAPTPTGGSPTATTAPTPTSGLPTATAVSTATPPAGTPTQPTGRPFVIRLPLIMR
ncbi:MAG TPA: S8 family serine peptidase [Herpetosiphonaceae bacterium]|nr:S8 family serine peptidase [Herpetosiphonaceae bacterium]